MKRREEALDNFRDNPEVPVFLLNRLVGSMGINLTEASHIMILEASWNPVWEEQAVSRAHRLGQKGPIEVRRYVVQGAPPAPFTCASAARPSRGSGNHTAVHADSVESRLHELMVAAHESDDGKEAALQDAVQGKETFATDEKALNERAVKIFRQQEIALLLGDLDELQTEADRDLSGDEEEDDDDDEQPADA